MATTTSKRNPGSSGRSAKKAISEKTQDQIIKLNKDVTEFILDNANKEITYQDLVDVFYNGDLKKKIEKMPEAEPIKSTSRSKKMTTIKLLPISSITDSEGLYKINLGKKHSDLPVDSVKQIMENDDTGIVFYVNSVIDDTIAEAFILKLQERISSYGDDLGFEYLCSSYMKGKSLKDIISNNVFIAVV